MYLECTCSQISIEKWKQKMKNSRPLNYGWLVRRIKKQLPLLYKELCLEFYNPWENQCRVNRDYYILVHSAIEYFIRKEKISEKRKSDMINQMKEETALQWLSSFCVHIKDVFK